MGRKGLIFDCDGTLMDSIGAWHEAELRLLAEVGATMTKEERDEVNALTLEEAGTYFHEHYGACADAEQVVQKVLAYLLDFYQTRSEANPGALEFVKAAHEAGAVLSVLSSSPQSFLQAGLSRGGFMPYIDYVVSVEDIPFTKREPAAYGYMCDLMGCAREDAWLFDDSWYAVATAREAGLHTVGVFSTDNCGTHEELARYCDIVVDSFAELTPADLN